MVWWLVAGCVQGAAALNSSGYYHPGNKEALVLVGMQLIITVAMQVCAAIHQLLEWLVDHHASVNFIHPMWQQHHLTRMQCPLQVGGGAKYVFGEVCAHQGASPPMQVLICGLGLHRTCTVICVV